MLKWIGEKASNTLDWLASTWLGKKVGACRDAILDANGFINSTLTWLANTWLGVAAGSCKNAVVNSWVVTSISSAFSKCWAVIFGSKVKSTLSAPPEDEELSAFEAAKQALAAATAREEEVKTNLESADLRARLAEAEVARLTQSEVAARTAQANLEQQVAALSAGTGQLAASTETAASLVDASAATTPSTAAQPTVRFSAPAAANEAGRGSSKRGTRTLLSWVPRGSARTSGGATKSAPTQAPS